MIFTYQGHQSATLRTSWSQCPLGESRYLTGVWCWCRIRSREAPAAKYNKGTPTHAQAPLNIHPFIRNTRCFWCLGKRVVRCLFAIRSIHRSLELRARWENASVITTHIVAPNQEVSRRRMPRLFQVHFVCRWASDSHAFWHISAPAGSFNCRFVLPDGN